MSDDQFLGKFIKTKFDIYLHYPHIVSV